MKKILILSILIVLAFKSNSQITRGNWLIGGNADFSSTKNSSDATAKLSRTDFQISGIVGFFVMDKLNVGIKPVWFMETIK